MREEDFANDFEPGNCVPLLFVMIEEKRSGAQLTTLEVRQATSAYMLGYYLQYFRSLWDLSAADPRKMAFDGCYEEYATSIAENRSWWSILEIDAACWVYDISLHIHQVADGRTTFSTWFGPVLAVGPMDINHFIHHAEYDGEHYDLLHDAPYINREAQSWRVLREKQIADYFQGDSPITGAWNHPGRTDIGWMRGAGKFD